MTKGTFLEQIGLLKEYEKKIRVLYDADVISCEGFISDIQDTIGTLLILGVNDAMEDIHEDYFFETFWNSLDVEDFNWGEFYDKMKVGKAPDWYIERYS